MEDKQIIEKPKCVNFAKCKNYAICLFHDNWLCGECLVKLNKKVKKFITNMIEEEE